MESGETDTMDSLAASPEAPIVSSLNFTFSVKEKEVYVTLPDRSWVDVKGI
jgi:hypothetical protein